MGAIDVNAADAFWEGRSWRRSNTEVLVDDEGTTLKLWGNSIARLNPQGGLELSTSGWPTATTISRLRELLRNYHTTYLYRQDGEMWADYYCNELRIGVQLQVPTNLTTISQMIQDEKKLAHEDGRYIEGVYCIQDRSTRASDLVTKFKAVVAARFGCQISFVGAHDHGNIRY